MKKMTAGIQLVFESDKDMEDYEDFKEAIKNGEIKIGVSKVSVLDEEGNDIPIDVENSNIISSILGSL
jgi:hypothetical protein